MPLRKNLNYIFTLIDPLQNSGNVEWILLDKDVYYDAALEMKKDGIVEIKDNPLNELSFYIKLKRSDEILDLFIRLNDLTDKQRGFIFKQFCKYCGTTNPICDYPNNRK